jgi:ATP-binding protein involved in chromosome partitioning
MREKILNALRQVDDPDLKKDVVTLGMVQDLKIEGKKVSFRLVLTTPACPLKDVIKNACITVIRQMVDKDLDVDVILDAAVKAGQAAQKGIPGIKNIIAVASGKGGVGKSTVAVNLAIALAQSGAKTGIVDADIYGPSLPTMLGLKGERPQVRQEGQKMHIIPFDKYGVKAMSVGMLVDENQPLVWRGPMITTALRQLMQDVEWDELDYLVVDMPPGTGDIYITMAQQFPPAGVVVVTTPQQVALADTRKSIEMFRMPAINIPILGIVENMSWFTPAELPDSRYFIFGKGGGQELADQYHVPLLAQLPLFLSLTEEADKGIPAILQPNLQIRADFKNMAEKVAQQISIGNEVGA